MWQAQFWRPPVCCLYHPFNWWDFEDVLWLVLLWVLPHEPQHDLGWLWFSSHHHRHHSLNGHGGIPDSAMHGFYRPSNSLKYQTPPRSKHSGAIWAHKRSASKLAMENPSICRWISMEKEGEHDIQICQIRCVLYINYICTYITRGLEAASRELIFLFSWCLPKKVQYSSFFKLESKTIYASCYPKTSCNVRNAHVTLTLYI